MRLSCARAYVRSSWKSYSKTNDTFASWRTSLFTTFSLSSHPIPLTIVSLRLSTEETGPLAIDAALVASVVRQFPHIRHLYLCVSIRPVVQSSTSVTQQPPRTRLRPRAAVHSSSNSSIFNAHIFAFGSSAASLHSGYTHAYLLLQTCLLAHRSVPRHLALQTRRASARRNV